MKAKVKKKKAKAKARKKAKKKAAKAGPIGRTSKVGVIATWVKAFQDNAKAPRNKRKTDEQISKYMKSEFPGRKSKVFDTVQLVRNRYNKGALTGGVVPEKESVRYDKKGEQVTARGAKRK